MSKEKVFIKDLIMDDYKWWKGGETIFIESPTGSGKTTFVLEELVDYAVKNGKEVLYISNRYLLKEQIKNKVAKSQGINSKLINNFDKVSEFDGITIISYQKLQELQERGGATELKTLRYAFIVFDECHYLMQDSLFNPGIIYSLEFIKKVIGTKVFMSATIDEVKNFLLENEIVGKRIGRERYEVRENVYKQHLDVPMNILCAGWKCIWEYEFDKETRCYNFFYYDSEADLADIVRRSNDKFLIFISNKSKITDWEKILGEKCVYICAENRENKIIEQIIEKEKFEENKLIATPVIDNGVNFIDSELKNIVIDTYDKTEFIQMIGRKRMKEGEICNIYIPTKSINYFNGILNLYVKKSMDTIKQIRNENRFFNMLLCDENFYFSVKRFFLFREGAPVINPCAISKLEGMKRFLEQLMKELHEDKYAFVKCQLSWIGQEKSFDIRRHVRYEKEEKGKCELIDFLEAHCQIELSPKEQKEFANQLLKLSDKAGLLINHKSGRKLGKCKINKFLEKNKVPFYIWSKKARRKGEKTKWIIRRRANDDLHC